MLPPEVWCQVGLALVSDCDCGRDALRSPSVVARDLLYLDFVLRDGLSAAQFSPSSVLGSHWKSLAEICKQHLLQLSEKFHPYSKWDWQLLDQVISHPHSVELDAFDSLSMKIGTEIGGRKPAYIERYHERFDLRRPCPIPVAVLEFVRLEKCLYSQAIADMHNDILEYRDYLHLNEGVLRKLPPATPEFAESRSLESTYALRRWVLQVFQSPDRFLEVASQAREVEMLFTRAYNIRSSAESAMRMAEMTTKVARKLLLETAEKYSPDSRGFTGSKGHMSTEYQSIQPAVANYRRAVEDSHIAHKRALEIFLDQSDSLQVEFESMGLGQR